MKPVNPKLSFQNLRQLLRTRVSRRPILTLSIAVIVLAEIVLLRPTSLENPPDSEGRGLIPRDEVLRRFVPADPPLAPGIPYTEIPNYNLMEFQFLSSKSGTKQWRILANRAHLYQSRDMVHAVTVEAFLFNPDEETTHVTAKEAKYMMNDKELELFGQVKAVFPDGFVLESEYLRYEPETRIVSIPRQYAVRGQGEQDTGRVIRFTSKGLHFALDGDLVDLPEAADFTLERTETMQDGYNGMPESTRVRSDQALINRRLKTAHFQMYPTRKAAERFVRVEQPQMRLRSRTVEVNYDDFERELRYMVAKTDVAMKEEGEDGDPVRYATCGQADFDARVDKITLTQLPQVYQDSDTITGEVITIYRDTDTVEVEQSNAFSEGNGKS